MWNIPASSISHSTVKERSNSTLLQHVQTASLTSPLSWCYSTFKQCISCLGKKQSSTCHSQVFGDNPFIDFIRITFKLGDQSINGLQRRDWNGYTKVKQYSKAVRQSYQVHRVFKFHPRITCFKAEEAKTRDFKWISVQHKLLLREAQSNMCYIPLSMGD